MLLRHWLAAAAMAAVLSGCGGVSGPQVLAPALQPPVDPAPLDRTVEDILTQRMAVATAPVVTSFGGDVAVCEALGCPVIDGVHVDASADAVRLPNLSAFERLSPRRGIDRATRSYRQQRLNDPVSYRAFGAWTEHGFFLVETSLSEESREFTYRAWWFGDASDTTPVAAAGGSASWSGIMIGVTDGSPGEGGKFIHGDADLTVTGLGVPDAAYVDVLFTNLVREDSGATLDNMVWQGLPLQGRSFGTNDVRFHEADRGYTSRASFGTPAEGSLFGHVHGPNGEEVGGLFHRDDIAGAFAAKRNE